MDLFSPEFEHQGWGCIDHLRKTSMSYEDIAKKILEDYVSKIISKEYLEKVRVIVRQEGCKPVEIRSDGYPDYPLVYIWQYYPDGRPEDMEKIK